MKVEDHIGLIGLCNECSKHKKISLATDRGKDVEETTFGFNLGDRHQGKKSKQQQFQIL